MIEILGTVQSALGISKQIRELAEKASTAEFKLAIANLTEQLAEIKLQAVELSAENQRLNDEIRNLKTPPKLQFRENAYYHDDGTGPFCPGCYDGQRKLIRMVEFSAGSPERRMLKHRFKCSTCDKAIT